MSATKKGLKSPVIYKTQDYQTAEDSEMMIGGGGAGTIWDKKLSGIRNQMLRNSMTASSIQVDK